MATMPKAIVEVECKHERECAVHSKFLLDIIRDALGAFTCTQRPDMYADDHWSRRAQRVIGDRSRLPESQARTCREQIGDSRRDCTFDDWWCNTGSGIGPHKDDDMESHALRVARAAWYASMSNMALTNKDEAT